MPQVIFIACGTERALENLYGGREDFKGPKASIITESTDTGLQQLSVLVSRLIPGPVI